MTDVEIYCTLGVFLVFIACITSKLHRTKSSPKTWLSETSPHESDHVVAAFKDVMTGVEIQPITSDKIRQIIIKNFDENLDVLALKCFRVLHGSNWKWHDLDKWYNFFNETNKFPYLWKEYVESRRSPKTVTSRDLAQGMRKDNLKTFLERHHIEISQKALKSDLVELTKNFSPEDFRSLFNEEKWLNVYIRENNLSEYHACFLLVHTICMRSSRLRDAKNYMEINKEKISPAHYRCRGAGGCEIEQFFAQKWQRGKLDGLPPFFPGDRTCLEMTHRWGRKLEYHE